jgi:biopolymer transport protein ExbD
MGAEEVKELPRVQPPPTPLKLNVEINKTPLVVIVLPVLVEVNVTTPLVFHTVPVRKDIEPRMSKVGDVPC